MEHTSGFRPPDRDFTRAQDAKRAKKDHASRNFERHMDERFKARRASRVETPAASETEGDNANA